MASGPSSAHWLTEHGLGDDFADFLSPADQGQRASSSGKFRNTVGRWRYPLRSMLHH